MLVGYNKLMNNTMRLHQPGETVTVLRWDDTLARVRVIGVHNDIQNGRAGYDLADGTWCYADQIVGR
jgi:hypothetical protein